MNPSRREEARENSVRKESHRRWETAREQLVSIASSSQPVYFRGQSNAEWPLESRFGRLFRDLVKRHKWNGVHASEDKKQELQRNLLQQFKRALAWIPAPSGLYEEFDEKSDEFLALAQHYGLPTELLDWTQSPYIAAFFAFDGAKTTVFDRGQEVAIWGLDARALEALLCTVHRAELEAIRAENWPRIDIVQITGNANRRLVYQEGLFTRAFMVEDNIEEYFGSKSKHAQGTVLTKIIIPGSEQAKALRDLSLMSIRPVTMMNDPEGAAATAFNTVVRFGLNQPGTDLV